MPKGKTVKFKVGRKADTGEFASISYARKHKRTAIVETIVRKRKPAN